MITICMAQGVAQISAISAISAGLFKNQPYRLNISAFYVKFLIYFSF